MKRNIKFIQITLNDGADFIFNAFSIVSIGTGKAPQSIRIIFTNNRWVEYESHLSVKDFTEEVLKAINGTSGHNRIYQSASQLIKRGLKCISQIITKSSRY